MPRLIPEYNLRACKRAIYFGEHEWLVPIITILFLLRILRVYSHVITGVERNDLERK